MLAKLASTQRIVAGLVSKDFSEIKRAHSTCEGFAMPLSGKRIPIQFMVITERSFADKRSNLSA